MSSFHAVKVFVDEIQHDMVFFLEQEGACPEHADHVEDDDQLVAPGQRGIEDEALHHLVDESQEQDGIARRADEIGDFS